MGARQLVGQVVEPAQVGRRRRGRARRGRRSAARPRRAAGARPLVATSAAKRSPTAPSPTRYRCGQPAATFDGHVPRRLRGHDARQARRHHGRAPARSSPTPSSTPRPTGSRQLLRAAGLRPGDHVAFCLENHPRYFEIVWGGHYAGLIYTACSSRLTVRRARLHRQRLRRPGLHHLALQGRAGGRDRRRHARACELRLMLDGAVDGLRVATRTAVAAQPADAARRPVARRRHALLVGHDRAAEGREGARCPTSRSARPPTLAHGSCTVLFGFTRRTASTCRRRRSTTRRRCASAWRCSGSAARSSSWSTSTPSRPWPSSSATASPTASGCRPCSSAC